MPAVRSKNRDNVFINQNFVIRYQNLPDNKTRLIGAGKYHTIVGEDLKNKHFHKVINGQQDSYTFLIRNRLKIKFCSK